MPADRDELQPRGRLVFRQWSGPELRDGSQRARGQASQVRHGATALPVTPGRQPEPYRGPGAGRPSVGVLVPGCGAPTLMSLPQPPKSSARAQDGASNLCHLVRPRGCRILRHRFYYGGSKIRRKIVPHGWEQQELRVRDCLGNFPAQLRSEEWIGFAVDDQSGNRDFRKPRPKVAQREQRCSLSSGAVRIAISLRRSLHECAHSRCVEPRAGSGKGTRRRDASCDDILKGLTGLWLRYRR